MFKRLKKYSFEHVDPVPHPDYEVRETSVSEYFRKYSGGKSADLPQDIRPEVTDDRSTDEMLDDESRTNHMSCDDLDALQEMNDNLDNFRKALEDIELTKTQREQFLQATKVIDDPNSDSDAKREAYELLEELHDKVTRVRTK